MDKNSPHSSEDKFSDQIIPWEGGRNPHVLSTFRVCLGPLRFPYFVETENLLLKVL